jgi:hypothetical protein
MWGGHPDVSSGSPVEDRAVAPRTAVIRLELHLADDSMTGRASDGTGAAREFVGWLGLVAAIDALLPADVPVPISIRPVDERELS